MDWNALAKHLAECSAKICRDNDCNEDRHNCESYAYISADGLLDLCGADYFQGSSKPYAAISLPWLGTGEELKKEVLEEIEESEA